MENYEADTIIFPGEREKKKKKFQNIRYSTKNFEIRNSDNSKHLGKNYETSDVRKRSIKRSFEKHDMEISNIRGEKIQKY